jgi:ribosomal protein S18 acetylase RimI-like enzyme
VDHRSYLLEVSEDAFRPKAMGPRRITLHRATAGQHARCAALWRDVGRGFWTSRCRWSAARWRMHLRQDTVSFCIARRRGQDIGFVELVRYRRGVKIEGFGLLPKCRGVGLGAGLLTGATRRAFQLGAARIWLHTATDDHPHALPNYLARGFRIYRERRLKHPMRAADARPRSYPDGAPISRALRASERQQEPAR